MSGADVFRATCRHRACGWITAPADARCCCGHRQDEHRESGRHGCLAEVNAPPTAAHQYERCTCLAFVLCTCPRPHRPPSSPPAGSPA